MYRTFQFQDDVNPILSKLISHYLIFLTKLQKIPPQNLNMKLWPIFYAISKNAKKHMSKSSTIGDNGTRSAVLLIKLKFFIKLKMFKMMILWIMNLKIFIFSNIFSVISYFPNLLKQKMGEGCSRQNFFKVQKLLNFMTATI